MSIKYQTKTVSTIRGSVNTDGLKKNWKNYNKFSYWIQGVDVTQQNLNTFNPYTKGVSRLFLYTCPRFMEIQYPTQTANFKSMVETGFTKIDGIQDLEVESNEYQGGFNGQKFQTAKQTTDNTNSITISLYEQTGLPATEYLDTWATGMRDPRSGLAHYHGLLASKGASFYSEENHTAEFIYMTLDPTGLEIEYACMFAHCYPNKVEKSFLNFESGDRGEVLLNIEMSATKYESTHINDIARWYLDTDLIYVNYLDFNPHITKTDVESAYSLQLSSSWE